MLRLLRLEAAANTCEVCGSSMSTASSSPSRSRSRANAHPKINPALLPATIAVKGTRPPCAVVIVVIVNQAQHWTATATSTTYRVHRSAATPMRMAPRRRRDDALLVDRVSAARPVIWALQLLWLLPLLITAISHGMEMGRRRRLGTREEQPLW